jgi:hypothetical protein
VRRRQRFAGGGRLWPTRFLRASTLFSDLRTPHHWALLSIAGAGVEIIAGTHVLALRQGVNQSRTRWPGHPHRRRRTVAVDSRTRFRSIAICSYNDGDWMNPAVIVERTKAVIATLGGTVTDDATIRAEIDVDQRFIGEDYAVPSPESTAAIRELARNEGIFVGPVYTGKGFAGLLDHARTRRFPAAATSSSSTPATPATCSSPPRRRCLTP